MNADRLHITKDMKSALEVLFNNKITQPKKKRRNIDSALRKNRYEKEALVELLSGTTNNILKRINDAKNNDIKVDFILFGGGTNDASSVITVGTTVNGYNTTFDIQHFAERLRRFVKLSSLTG